MSRYWQTAAMRSAPGTWITGFGKRVDQPRDSVLTHAQSRSVAFNSAVTVLAFGLVPLLKKLALVQGAGPWTVALITAACAGLASVAALTWKHPGALRCLVSRRYRIRLCLLGVFATGVVTLLVVQALTVTTATNRSLFQSAYPAATLLLAHLLLGERLRLPQYLAVALLMTGLLLMNGDTDGLRFGPGFWLLLATLPLIGLSDVYGKRWSGDLSPDVLAAGRNLYGAIFLACVTPLLGLALISDVRQWLILIAAGLLQGIGVWTLYRALEAGKASLVAAMIAAAPLLTLVTERMYIGLQLESLQWIGFAVVLGAAGWLALGGRDDDPGRKARGEGRHG
jgi:drug/metabolite transporter (DMT)-like permease